MNDISRMHEIMNLVIRSGAYKSQEYASGAGNFTVPAKVHTIDILAIGAGGGGVSGGGGAGGIAILRNIGVSPGDLIAYSVGAGGAAGAAGGNTTIGNLTVYGGSGATAGTGGAGGAQPVISSPGFKQDPADIILLNAGPAGGNTGVNGGSLSLTDYPNIYVYPGTGLTYGGGASPYIGTGADGDGSACSSPGGGGGGGVTGGAGGPGYIQILYLKR